MSGTKNQARPKQSPRRRGGATKRRSRTDLRKESAWSGGRSDGAGKPISCRALVRALNAAAKRIPDLPPIPDLDEPLPFEVVADAWHAFQYANEASAPEQRTGQFELPSQFRAVADACLSNGCWLLFKCHEAHAVAGAARLANQLKQRVAIHYSRKREALIVWGANAREDWPEYEERDG